MYYNPRTPSPTAKRITFLWPLIKALLFSVSPRARFYFTPSPTRLQTLVGPLLTTTTGARCASKSHPLSYAALVRRSVGIKGAAFAADQSKAPNPVRLLFSFPIACGAADPLINLESPNTLELANDKPNSVQPLLTIF